MHLCCAVAAVLLGMGLASRAADSPFRAGAHQVDVSPSRFPSIVNGGFTERTADTVVDRLHAKALVLDDGESRVAFCVVDSCMVPRDLIDQARNLAAKATGIPADRMMVSSTHTHSAPAAMGCLGSRVDADYAASLPARIAEAILGANQRRVPARVGWIAVDDWEHTFNRRWIRKPDRMLQDPFGDVSVRAHMHPGHESPDVVGPSGPVDPGLTLLGVTTPDGRPLAVLANYSQHYYGAPLLSSDYQGRFGVHLAAALGADDAFVGIFSQGTSGDLMWMDYGSPREDRGYDAYAKELAARAADAWGRIRWQDRATVRSAERSVTLRYRVPDAARLAWARRVTAAMGDRLPQTQAEIYAWEAIHLHERQQAELRLQAVRVGDLAITALPNEVFAITGLKLKARSPLPVTMNVALANGAEGYIPPPEQHALGGYTTWPARTAGLEPQAEPRIVETLLGLLEEVAGRPRRAIAVVNGPYADAVLASRPAAYWRLEDMVIPDARDLSGHGRHATFEDGVALFLPGAGSGAGRLPQPALTASAFSGSAINRAVHCAGGRIRTRLEVPATYSVEGWFWNGLPHDARAVTGYLVSVGPDGDAAASGDHLGIGGTYRSEFTGRLFVFNGNARDQVLGGTTALGLRAWHHVVLVRDGRRVRVHLDGNPAPEIEGELDRTVAAGVTDFFLGGRNDRLFGLEGRVDEVAFYDRALTPDEVAAHHQASALQPPDRGSAAGLVPAAEPASRPLSPAESLAGIHVPEGFRVELAAAEPLTVDPVAIDWDAAGRLWVAEMSDYPLGMDGRGQPGGRVRILEDADGDGRMDRSTVFAQGLSFPNGLLTWRDGVLVTAAPEILFLRDTDGDGRADRREVVVSGLLEGNQQLRANGLRWGLDNWVYCAAGGHHGNYGVGTRLRTRRGEVQVGSRDFRFRPDTGELEPESGPSQYGRNRDDWGRWFGTQNIRPLWHYVLADRYLRRNPHIAAPDPTRQVVVPLSPRVYPASPPEKRFHSFNEAGHFTSACAGMIYRDAFLFPGAAEGVLQAFTCEPFHNLVQHNVVTDDGVSFTARREPGRGNHDFFASEDRWCRPVMTRTGPDGALWVVDMYRYMIEHPEWLPAEGKAELLPHYRLGDDRGRIYRVLPADRAPRRVPRLDRLAGPELVAALDSANEWQRDKVHQRLVQFPEGADLPALRRLASRMDRPLARVHALGVLEGLGALESEHVLAALADPHPGVRENALRLAERHGTGAVIARAVALVGDPSPKVRLQLALTLGEWRDPSAGRALGELAVASAGEPFLVAAVLSSAVPHCGALAEAVVRAGDPAMTQYAEPLADLALALREREALAALLAPVFNLPSGRLSAVGMDRLAHFLALARRRQVELDGLGAGTDALARQIRSLPAVFEAARAMTREEDFPVADRMAAAGLLIQDASSRTATMAELKAWLRPDRPAESQRAAITVLAATGDDAVPGLLLADFAAFTPGTRAAVVEVLLGREPWAHALLEQGGPLAVAALDATRRAQVLRHPSSRVRTAAAARVQPVPNRADVIERYQGALRLEGDAGRGREVFDRLCVVCHRHGGAGGDVGPDLVSVMAHPPEKLLANILDPSADVQPGYQAYHCELADGTELYGVIAAETGNSVVIRLADGSSRGVLRRDIRALRGSIVSLMPDGLEEGLTPQALADLIRFLRQPPAATAP